LKGDKGNNETRRRVELLFVPPSNHRVKFRGSNLIFSNDFY
jgi:hypothetical protein